MSTKKEYVIYKGESDSDDEDIEKYGHAPPERQTELKKRLEQLDVGLDFLRNKINNYRKNWKPDDVSQCMTQFYRNNNNNNNNKVPAKETVKKIDVQTCSNDKNNDGDDSHNALVQAVSQITDNNGHQNSDNHDSLLHFYYYCNDCGASFKYRDEYDYHIYKDCSIGIRL